MRGEHEDPQEEFKKMCIEALQEAYKHLSVDHLATLCVACGIKVTEAFPWIKDERKSA